MVIQHGRYAKLPGFVIGSIGKQLLTLQNSVAIIDPQHTA